MTAAGEHKKELAFLYKRVENLMTQRDTDRAQRISAVNNTARIAQANGQILHLIAEAITTARQQDTAPCDARGMADELDTALKAAGFDLSIEFARIEAKNREETAA